MRGTEPSLETIMREYFACKVRLAMLKGLRSVPEELLGQYRSQKARLKRRVLDIIKLVNSGKVIVKEWDV